MTGLNAALSARKITNLATLKAMINDSVRQNPYQRPAMAVPPTVAASTTTDTTLAAPISFITSNALTSAAQNKVQWIGGYPVPIANAYVCLAVTSSLPSTAAGNLAGYANAFGTTGDLSAFASGFEIMTDSDVFEVCLYTNSNKTAFFQVDGEYVDKTGVVGIATNAENFIKLTFASRKVRRIRVIVPTVAQAGYGPTPIKQIRIKATCDIWKPDQTSILRLGWMGDSYGETYNSVVPYSGASAINGLVPIAGEVLGFRDSRQLVMGGTGWLSDAAAGRRKLRDQLGTYSPQGPFDLIVIAHGYNDYAFSPSLIAAEVPLALAAIRAFTPGVPIVVLGAQAGLRGPDATTLGIETAIQNGVTAFADSRCVFRPVSSEASPWLNGTGRVGTTNGTGNSDIYVSSDGVHPSAAGYEHLAFRAAIAVQSAVNSMY